MAIGDYGITYFVFPPEELAKCAKWLEATWTEKRKTTRASHWVVICAEPETLTRYIGVRWHQHRTGVRRVEMLYGYSC